MGLPIEDYGLIGDTQTAALVGKDGSIDWLCLPRFDSAALFSALLGDEDNGHWRIAPEAEVRKVNRRYREGTLVLETEFECAEGIVRLIDFMPPRDKRPDLMRIVEGVRGTVPMELDLTVRFDYGSIVPWIQRSKQDARTLLAVAGPDALRFDSGVDIEAREFAHTARFSVTEGEQIPFVITWYKSHEESPEPLNPSQALEDTVKWWRSWVEECNYQGEWHEEVHRSLLVLKALTYAPTGGIVAAPTTSLPEQLGGVRNWDYRYCWIRDATLTLNTLLVTGHSREAVAWRDWLLRAVAGEPRAMQILYGPAGERRLAEYTIPWLPGYEGSAPVRVGNAAANQFQLDVYGEIMDAMHQARSAGMEPDAWAWGVQKGLLDIRNDLGLLSESYDVGARRLVGNFPQAFTHVGLINTARILSNTDPTG